MVDPQELVHSNSIDLDESDLNQLFIFMLSKQLGEDRFIDLVEHAATDMEVYGLVNSAEELKTFANHLKERKSYSINERSLMVAAIKLAIREGDPDAKKYLEAEKTEREARTAILEKYRERSCKEISNMLANASRKALTMNGPYARVIQSAISAMSSF